MPTLVLLLSDKSENNNDGDKNGDISRNFQTAFHAGEPPRP